MNIGKTLYVKTREEWRAWLAANHAREPEIWLIFYKKGSGQPRLPYEDAVEEALCFGWIDSILKRVDEDHYVQKFSPRQAKSAWSVPNKKRVAKMIREGRMTEAGLASVTYPNPEHEPQEDDKKQAAVVLPPDLKRAVRADPQARANLTKIAPGTLRMYVRIVEDAKKPETRARRISRVVEFIARNRRPDINERI